MVNISIPKTPYRKVPAPWRTAYELPFLFDPMVMMVIGFVLSEALRQLRKDEFLARQPLREQATTDQLTGLLNRRTMLQLLQQEHARARRYGATYSLILGDLDRLKVVNDCYGHNIGDIVLQEAAPSLDPTVTADDIKPAQTDEP
ncbi:diguanylate cyclase [uncultured Marinobacter sp.]|uniref:GGDEF domain-containing protein n=1 Tax=uncultured Marinobacter sp. TaxID=187379 RepID=UPI00262CD287|nr:diguanylate cyclase [uncultured Marinobacter sp.]